MSISDTFGKSSPGLGELPEGGRGFYELEQVYPSVSLREPAPLKQGSCFLSEEQMHKIKKAALWGSGLFLNDRNQFPKRRSESRAAAGPTHGSGTIFH